MDVCFLSHGGWFFNRGESLKVNPSVRPSKLAYCRADRLNRGGSKVITGVGTCVAGACLGYRRARGSESHASVAYTSRGRVHRRRIARCTSADSHDIFQTFPAVSSDEIPGNVLELVGTVAKQQFGNLLSSFDGTVWEAITHAMADPLDIRTPSTIQSTPAVVNSLTLDIEKVVEHEPIRGVPPNPALVRFCFFALSWSLDRLFTDRPIAKFWVLETVARLPYFAYVSVLHLYETMGWWRALPLRQMHTNQEYNETHHVLVMEALGGSANLFDRVFAYNTAFAYYWLLCGLYLASPGLAYGFSVSVEEHAYLTYSEFIEQNADTLREMPVPSVAVTYSQSRQPLGFGIHNDVAVEHPPCKNMLEVFQNIRDDELQHLFKLAECQRCALAGSGTLTRERTAWLDWSEAVNSLARSHDA